MEICKTPTLRLKALNKHTHIMYIEMENVIQKNKYVYTHTHRNKYHTLHCTINRSSKHNNNNNNNNSKASTLRLKVLNKHTHIMYIKMANVIKEKKEIKHIDMVSRISMQNIHTHTLYRLIGVKDNVA